VVIRGDLSQSLGAPVQRGDASHGCTAGSLPGHHRGG
jgi:hypothetical protein